VFLGGQTAIGFTGKHPKMTDLIWGHVDLHSIQTVMSFHKAKLWQNENFHRCNHMNIIIIKTD
jgi:hypothetical protein